MQHRYARSICFLGTICSTSLRKWVWVAALLAFSSPLLAQPFPMFNGTVNTCVGAFLDSGGQGASGYSNNEDITYTICPDVPGGAISINWITFNLSTAGGAPIDNMTVYDGNSTAAPVLGNWTGTGLQGLINNASASNPTGCLTFVFRSNGSGTGVFAGSITCYQPCVRPTAVATHGPTNPMRICPGESVTFNSTASFAAAGYVIASRRWDFGDGVIVNNAPAIINHTYAQPGGYTAQLYLLDNNGCASTNLVDLVTLVGTPPTFVGTGGTLSGCAGETVCLNGVVNATTWNELPNPSVGGGVFLPDNVGECFTSTVTFTQFAPGQTVTSPNDLMSICIDIEHSFIGDLIISLIAPTGEALVMHQQNGAGTYLGVPVDDDFQPNAQGTCFTYCWSPTATNGTWVDNAGGTLPAGTYESLNPFSDLIGAQLNGTWTIQICDMWASDNGFLCDWDLTFDPSLYDDLITFTPVYGAGCDSSYWTGPNITSQNANCEQACVTPPAPGNYNYVYRVTDNFGCDYDTTLTVNIIPGPQVNAGPDATTCNTPVQLNATVSGGGFPTNCNYVLTLYDSFGDGWTGFLGLGSNGSSVTVTVNGTPYSYWLANGGLASVNIPVTSGATVVVSYVAGNLYNDEQSFTLFNSTDGVVYASPLDPGTGQQWSGVANCPGGNYVYSWAPVAGLNNPNIANPVATVGGTTQYCVTVYQVGHPTCTSTDCMTITVDNLADPGTNANVAVCSNGAAINLFTQLGGTPTAGGTWTAPGGGAHSNTFVPGVDAPGIYTYTVGGAGACGNPVSSTVNVTVYPLPNAGTPTSLSACSTDAAQSLFALLTGAQAGGSWSGPSPVVGGNYNPVTMNPGVYTYTVNGTAPCPNASATVTVTENTPPDAGNNNNITLCNTDAPIVLTTQLGGTPDGTGSWTDPGGGASSGGLDPAVGPPGVYTYTVAGTAPCPNDIAMLTVAINQAPNAGTPGNITLCSTDAPASLFAQLGGGPQAGGAWTGPSPVVGGMINPATMNAGMYTYTVNGTAPCPNATTTVTVTINTPPNAGTPGNIALCSTSAPASLFAQLGGAPQAGGTWSGPSPVVGGMIDPATMSAGVYTYTVTGTAPCPNASATVTVTINTPPDPGTNGTITLCSTDAAASLFAQLGGTPDAGGAWTGPSPVVGGMMNPATMNAGVYTYTVTGAAPCPNANATVTVTINTPPDPGTNGTITLCSTDAAASLFAQLGGTPDAGGTWSGPSPVVGGMIDPATMSAGAYTYTVTGTAPCPNETATVTVTINTPPDPGTNGTITLCSTDAPASLFAQLGGTPDAGGAWTGPSPVVGGMINPATMSAGVYAYTVTGTAPCPNESATVTVTINTPPDPGTSGTITLCSTDAPAPLFAQLGGTPDAGGAWTGPSPVVGGMIDPATMSAGVYTYTVTGTAPCPNEQATVTVTINTPPDPGTNGTITLCSTDAPASLFTQLGGTPDAGGTWSGPSPVLGGMIDPATMSAGAYTYTVTGTTPCPNETATVTVTINTPPDPGTNGTITLCSTDAPTSLFAQLGGTPDAGGAWSGPSPVVGGMIDPATMNAGAYTYTVTGTAPCPNEIATVTVTINTPPDPGTNGTITLCSTDAPASLFAQLGGTPDAGGAWTGPSPVVGGMIDPATMSAGVYTYTVTGTAPCPNESATVTVTINTPPDPGTNGTITLCSTDAPTSLFAQLGGTPDAGGTWTGPSPIVGGIIDPATMSAGVYTYTVTGTTPCPNETAAVTVTINTPPDPGTNGTITLCSTDAPASLFAQLGGTPDAGGAWTGPSPVVGGMINPATMNAGVYTYTVTGTAPCPDETATVIVTINTPPDPGTNGTITVCSTDAPASLFAQLGGTPDVGGAWTGPSPIVGGMFDPATMSAGVYTYTVTGTAPCPNESATVTVTINMPPDPGTNGTITLCSTDAPASLFAQLGGTPDAGGAWIGPSPVVGGMINPATMSAGVYTYTVTGTAPCPNETATVTVTINQMPDAGIDGGLTLCSSSPATQLSTGLNGTPDPGGTWTAPGGGASNGTFTPGTSTVGIYTYTVNGIAPCPAVSATVDVNVVTNPDAGTPGSATVCATDAATLLFSELGGTPDAGGTWSGPSPVVGGQYDPATMNAGVYTYTITVPLPCVNVSSTVTITEVAPPNAGTDGAITLCISSPAASLFAALGGGAQAGGSWSGPSPVVGGMFNPGTMTAGVYTYTVNGTAPCPNDAATVTVTVVTAPDAGTPGNETLCSTDAAIDLFTELGGTPDAGGAWSGPSPVVGGQYDPATMNAGVYTYTIVVPPPCVNASSTVAITEAAPPNAGTDGAITLCISSPAASLFAALGGAQAGGSWSGPSPVVGGLFNPATMTAGVYTYTVTGTTPCPNDDATVTVTVVTAPDAGTPGNATLCATDAAIDLFAELGGTPDAGGAWSGPSPVVGGQYDPATMNAGIYTYTITVPLPCVNVSSTVTITEVAPPNAGSDGAITLCISSPAASLFAALGVGAQAGGSWSGPSPVVGGMFNPATMSAGAYTYTVNGTAPCPNDQSTVTVNVVSAPDAGTPGSATLCATDAAIDLFAELGGTPDAGGAWSGPSSVVGGQYDPATMNAGVYTYTITVPLPCVNVSSTVTITEVVPPNAGIDGAITLCISSPATSLFAALGGGAQAGGNWNGPSPVAGGMFNPATMNAGVYTYTIAGTTPCPNDQSTVTVNVVSAPDAGTPGSATLCATDAAIDLFTELGGTPDAGGAWSGPSPMTGGQYDPATMNAGVYTYTITVPLPCVNVSSTVTITEVAPPNAGSDGAITLCISSPATSLFAALGGGAQAGGNWNGPSPVAGGMFNPATMNAGVYTYTLNGTAPCPNDQSTVTVTVVTEPDPGTDGAITLCATDASVSLFAQLGGTPDAGGTWSGPSPIVGDVFDPATMSAGVYTYTITVPPPCSSLSSTVTVAVVQPPNAGIDGALTLCITSPSAALFNSLGGSPQAGGTWSGPSPVTGGLFDPATMSAGVYTYTVNGTAPCPNDAATVTVTVVSEPDPGGPGALTVCSSDGTQDLFSSIEGSPDQGGGWTMPGGATFDGFFDPVTMSSGVYTYTITVPPPCISVSTTVTVDVIAPPNAGIDGAITLCFSNPPTALFASLGGNPDAGGTWTTSGGAPFSGTFDPAVDAPGVFTYTAPGIAPCPADVATVTVAVTQLPNPGTDDIINLCVVGGPVDLFPVLGAADPGGTWSGPGGSASNGIFTPGTNTPGGYTYTVSGVAPCPSASAVITVNVLSNADAGLDGVSTLCGDNVPMDLFNLLGGTPDAGGSWFAPDGSPAPDSFDPSTQPAGTYTYILYVPAPCENDTSEVLMSIVAPVDAGLYGSATMCSNDAPVTLFNVLNGTPDAGGSWTGPGGANEGIFDPATDIPGGYVYTVQATAPCLDQSATVDVAVNPLPDAGTNGSITLCPEASPIALFSLLGGTPMSGGTWTGPGGIASNGIFDPATSPQGVYTYTVFGILPCPNATASSTATVFLIAPPNAGPDAVSCTLEFTLNASGNWASGTWTGPPGITFSDPTSPTSSVTASAGGSYTFTWSILSNDGCATQDQVTITFTEAIVPVVAITDAICNGVCNGTAQVSATGGNTVGGVYSYQWSNGIAGNAPSAAGICAGDYTVTVFDMNNCNTVAPFTIGEPDVLAIDAITATDETCPGDCDGTIAVIDPEGVQYSLNGGTFTSTAFFHDLCPGEFVIVMQDANGCTATGSAEISTPAPVIAGFTYTPETLLVSNPLAQFANASSPNASTFSWDFGGLGTSNAENPAFTFPGGLGDSYMVCLTVTDVNGCPDDYCEPVEVFDVLLVHVPNAFTPNHDGENDGFAPIFNLPWAVEDYEFMIFDRWGELIHQSTVVHAEWDGWYRNEIVKEDVYVWKMKCRDKLTGELIQRVGHVTVLK